MGHEIVQSGSGGRARRLLRAGHYDALVSDYLMPGMTGMGLAAEARLAQQGVRHPLQERHSAVCADLR